MILFRVQMRLPPVDHERVVRSLARILEPTRALHGCLDCRLGVDIEDEHLVTYTEEWQDQQCLEQRLRGDSLRVVLAALDYASDPPRVSFETVCQIKGIELIADCRKAREPGARWD